VTTLVSGWKGAEPRAGLDGLEVHRAGRRNTFSVAAPLYFRRHLARRGFDVVVEDLNKVPLFTPLWTDAPTVLLAHHLFGATAFGAASPPVAAVTWLLERAVPPVFRGVPCMAVSESTKMDLVARGLRGDDIEVVPNGIDVDRYTPGPDALRSSRPSLLFLGRLKEYKRIDLVLGAVATLAARGCDVELVVAGEGERMKALRAMARRMGIEQRVRFTGFVSEERKLELLRRAWVHVLTSSKEGWGISNLEAAACGVPSVASDAPGLRESVQHGTTGLLVPHGDVDALVAALDTLLQSPELRERMGRAARAFAEGFSWDASADRAERFLNRVVARGGPG
jgi:glycosyltransferase involved in cell wall biosynthesis